MKGKVKRWVAVCAVATILIAAAIIGVCGVWFSLDKYYYADKLNQAIRAGDHAAVRSMVEKHPDCVNVKPYAGLFAMLDVPTHHPLGEACKVGDVETVEYLLQHGAKVNCCGRSFPPLCLTYTQKPDSWYQISVLLIENGASVDYTTSYSAKKSSVLRDIVQSRPGANAPDYVPEQNEEVMKAFHYALENCDRGNVDWMRVLQHSVSNDRIEIVKYVLDQGYCDVNDTSVGMTALMFAVRDSTPEMVELLLSYGADPLCVDDDGNTAYDIAVEFGKEESLCLPEGVV